MSEVQQPAPSPFPPPPSTPNVYTTSVVVPASPEQVATWARSTLQEMRPRTLEPDGQNRYHAVFRVFVFSDDVWVVVLPEAGGSRLHIRSQSRMGNSDLGVNRRRVERFFRAFHAVRERSRAT